MMHLDHTCTLLVALQLAHEAQSGVAGPHLSQKKVVTAERTVLGLLCSATMTAAPVGRPVRCLQCGAPIGFSAPHRPLGDLVQRTRQSEAPGKR